MEYLRCKSYPACKGEIKICANEIIPGKPHSHNCKVKEDGVMPNNRNKKRVLYFTNSLNLKFALLSLSLSRENIWSYKIDLIIS
jgi:hypothetical protein